jgi:hypothetical protein
VDIVIAGKKTGPLFFFLFLRFFFLGLIAAVTGFVFQRSMILSGEWLGLQRFILYALLFCVFFAAAISAAASFALRVSEVRREGERITLFFRGAKEAVSFQRRDLLVDFRGRIRGLGRKISVSDGKEKYIICQAGFSPDNWVRAEALLYDTVIQTIKEEESTIEEA